MSTLLRPPNHQADVCEAVAAYWEEVFGAPPLEVHYTPSADLDRGSNLTVKDARQMWHFQLPVRATIRDVWKWIDQLYAESAEQGHA